MRTNKFVYVTVPTNQTSYHQGQQHARRCTNTNFDARHANHWK